MLIARRAFLTSLGALIAAPAVVRADNLMPVRNIARLYLPDYGFDSFNDVAPEMEYQWASLTVLGEPTGMADRCVDGGWSFVPAARYSKRFRLSGDRIEYSGCVLMERKRAFSTRPREIQAAHDLVTNWKARWQVEGFTVETRESEATVESPTMCGFGENP